MKTKNKILTLILLLALFARFFKFSETMSLNADYGMAYLIADRIIHKNFLMLVGPFTAF